MSDTDVVVVGGGIAGLVGAGLLAQAGCRVVLLEQHRSPGGCLGDFSREGFTFGVGPQSFSSGGIVLPVFRDLGGLEGIEFAEADWRIVAPRVDCRIRTYEGVLGAFADAHPDHAAELRRYFNDVFATSRDLGRLVAGPRAPYLLEGADRVGAFAGLLVQAAGAIARLAAAHHRPAAQVARRHLRDPDLTAFFSQIGYRSWSLFSAAASWYSWTSDSWYPVQGSGAMMEALADRARSHGADLRFGTRAARVLVTEGRAVGVEAGDGSTITAKAVLAAGDASELEHDLLERPEPRKGVDAVSDAYFALFLGLDMPDEELSSVLPTRHTFYYPAYDRVSFRSGDPEAHRGRWLQVIAASRGCPELAPSGHSTLIVQTSSRADWRGFWGCGPTKARTPEYGELKETVAEQVLDTLEELLPGVRERVLVPVTATPLTYERMTRNAHGASAGWTWERTRTPVPERVAETFGHLARVRTRVDGLYRCGHWTLSPGAVTGAVLSAWEAVSLIQKQAL